MDYTVTLAGIALANLLGIVSPGPAFFLVGRAAASHSRGHGLATAMGVAGAAILWAVAATFGVAVLMTRFATISGVIQLIGGVYLIWLGLMAWRQSAAPVDHGQPNSPTRLSRAALTGFTLSLTNPKIVIFFSSIFVALFPVDTPLWVRMAALGIVALQETSWYVLVACLLSRRRVQAVYQRINRSVEQVMGAVFVALGARIVALARV